MFYVVNGRGKGILKVIFVIDSIDYSKSLFWIVVVLVVKSCPILCDPMDCSQLGSSVHGISQARIQEWVAISYSRGSSQPRDQSQVSCIVRWILYHWASRQGSCFEYHVLIHLNVDQSYEVMLLLSSSFYIWGSCSIMISSYLSSVTQLRNGAWVGSQAVLPQRPFS